MEKEPYYLKCKKVETAINRAKEMLEKKARKQGIYENFGQEEVRRIRDKFIDISDYSMPSRIKRNQVDSFERWCSTYRGY